MTTIPRSRSFTLPGETRSPLLLRVGFWICIVIAVAVVLRRIFALAASSHSGPPQMAGLDDAFASHAALTLAHIIPALLFVLLAPFAAFARFARFRWPDRILFPLGAIVGLTAYAMSAYAVGGWIERSAVFFFDSLFLYALARAFWHDRNNQPVLKRRWLLRAIAVLLGIATTRPVMGLFFATSAVTHLAPNQFFGVAFWIGFSINTLVFELWLRSLDRRAKVNETARLGSPEQVRGVLL
ncbi:MAG TPA: DUF2306 domain-containing protein [Terracidiphilus sp.]|nr:DUF2306 domain-containing protein [Terracidiphilus sp.]